MVKAGKPKKPLKHCQLQEELGRELKHLRVIVREVGENFILRREGEIEAVISQLAGVPSGKLRAVASGLLDEIRNLKVKPEKGRLKDLKELDRLVDALAAQVIAAQDSGKTPRKKSDLKKP